MKQYNKLYFAIFLAFILSFVTVLASECDSWTDPNCNSIVWINKDNGCNPWTDPNCGTTDYCGDDQCNGNEDCSSCSSDCGRCDDNDNGCNPWTDPNCGTTDYCGDDQCNGNENKLSCPSDCGQPECFPGQKKEKSCGLTDKGACQLGKRTRSCNNHGKWDRWGRCDGAINPTIERCNNIDDDCDGKKDEGFNLGSSCTVGIGSCQRTGNIVCNSQSTGTQCSAHPGQPVTETCNNIDDDCDGSIDEDNVCVPVCIRTIERCNGLDDDCDGLIDEDLGSTTCGIGACQRTVQNCANGIPQTCVPDLPGQETCNNIDDDCDGLIDENRECSPSLNIPDQSINEDSGFNDNMLDLLQYTTDPNTPLSQLIFNVVSQTNPEIVSCLLDSNRFIDCTTKTNQNGYSDITISVTDGDSTVADVFRLNVLPVNDIPVVTFAKNSVCVAQQSNFNVRITSDVDKLASRVEWDFGDGSIAAGTEVKHKYKATGNYDLAIKVKDSNDNVVNSLLQKIRVTECDIHKIAITNAFIDDSFKIKPGDGIEVYTKVKNLGNVNEKVKLNIRIDELGIRSEEEITDFNLNNKEGRWNLMNLEVPYDAKKKEYVVKITASTKTETVVKYLSFKVE